MFKLTAKVKDKLTIGMAEAPKVLCAACGKHIFYLKKKPILGSSVKLTDILAPLENETSPSNGYPALCNFCNRPFLAFTDRGYKIKTNEGYVP